jgi:hypothetical protein
MQPKPRAFEGQTLATQDWHRTPAFSKSGPAAPTDPLTPYFSGEQGFPSWSPSLHLLSAVGSPDSGVFQILATPGTVPVSVRQGLSVHKSQQQSPGHSLSCTRLAFSSDALSVCGHTYERSKSPGRECWGLSVFQEFCTCVANGIKSKSKVKPVRETGL